MYEWPYRRIFPGADKALSGFAYLFIYMFLYIRKLVKRNYVEEIKMLLHDNSAVVQVQKLNIELFPNLCLSPIG